MHSKIVMSALMNQVQVGLVEDGRLAEFCVERDTQERLVGTIYKGQIENVLPGMSAAFVNIGAGRNAFLHVDDIPQYISGESIEEKVRKGQTIVVQVAKEAIGSKGARVTGNIG